VVNADIAQRAVAHLAGLVTVVEEFIADEATIGELEVLAAEARSFLAEVTR
jgi:hypothetical protein